MKNKKTLVFMFLICFLIIVMLGRSAIYGNVRNVERNISEPNGNHSEEDIEAAMDALQDYFHDEFIGCVLYEITYLNTDNKDNVSDYIVLRTTFECKKLSESIGFQNGEKIGHSGWTWVMEKKDGKWIHKDHGFM